MWGAGGEKRERVWENKRIGGVGGAGRQREGDSKGDKEKRGEDRRVGRKG